MRLVVDGESIPVFHRGEEQGGPFLQHVSALVQPVHLAVQAPVVIRIVLDVQLTGLWIDVQAGHVSILDRTAQSVVVAHPGAFKREVMARELKESTGPRAVGDPDQRRVHSPVQRDPDGVPRAAVRIAPAGAARASSGA